MSEPSLKLYGDFISQPFRAVYIFCLHNKIEFKLVELHLFKGDLFSDEFREVNPLGLVPAINDGGYLLSESATIMRYLTQTREVAEQWYPKDPKKRANVDRYCDWHPSGTRNIGRYIQALNAKFFPKGYITWTVEDGKKNMEKALYLIDSFFLNGRKYIASDDKMTIADLLCFCECFQVTILAKYDMKDYPNIQAWMKRMMEDKIVKEVSQKFVAGFQKPKM